MKKEIWFDMDGTIANLYGVEGWLEYLINESVYPYENAATIGNFSLLARFLNNLQRKGWKIGVISWTSKNGSDLYNGEVALAKLVWLHKHLPSVHWDEIKIVRYGTNKWETCGGGILFDDEEGNRKAWQGESYEPKDIFNILKALSA